MKYLYVDLPKIRSPWLRPWAIVLVRFYPKQTSSPLWGHINSIFQEFGTYMGRKGVGHIPVYKENALGEIGLSSFILCVLSDF